MIRILWATAALLAIFAMHGLAAHAGSPDATAVSVAAASHDGHAEHAATAVDVPAHGEHGHEMAVMGLCAAVLATSAVLLLVGLGRPRSGVLGLVPRAATVTSHPVGTRLAHAPPDLHALSILRC